MSHTQSLQALWHIGVDAVKGEQSVRQALVAQPISRPDQIIAVGKAATSMARAACDIFPGVPTLIVTKYDHGVDAPTHAHLIESAHPVPDANSLIAGQALIDVVQSGPPGSHLLCLVSGGASALAEALPSGWTLDDLSTETKKLLASGADIHAMNARRKEISRIKGGKLLQHFRGARITTLAISDVEGDALSVIGSGIGAPPDDTPCTTDLRIVASNIVARNAIARAATEPLIDNHETLYADVTQLAPQIATRLLNGPAGLYLLGGEPTVILPDRPGLGGRNMALGLTLAREISGHNIDLLVAGTDGTDGPTDAAGALINGQTWQDSAAQALETANAYPWLKAHNALFVTGPTGTNVMDLLIARKH